MSTHLFPPGSPDVLYLVDLSGYVFRAYHAIAPLNSPSGEPTQAVFGTVNMLERLVRECRPAYLAVAMDSRTPTFRKELYPEYKANRPTPPDDLKLQMRRVGELIEAFPLPCFQQDGMEADDLIATVVERSKRAGLKVVIVSADKDLMQLACDDVLLWDTMRNRVFGPEEVKARFGVEVEQVRDVLALMGDSSDNIPGVPSVGPKTASQLLNDYGSIDGVYEHVDEIKRKKLKEALQENREQALMSRTLVTLKNDVEVEFDREALRFDRRNTRRLRDLYAELGFQRQLQNLEQEGGSSPSPASSASVPKPPSQLTLLTTSEQLRSFAEQVQQTGKLAVVPYSLGDGPMSSVLVGLGVAAGPDTAHYIPLGHRYMGAPNQLPAAEVLSWLSSASRADVALFSHDARSLLVTLQRADADVATAKFDTQLAAYLLNPDAKNTLEALSQEELARSLISIDDLTRQKGSRTRLQLDEVNVDDTLLYCAQRAAAVFDLVPRLEMQLGEQNLDKLWRDVELPLLHLLAELEQRGILLDTDRLSQLNKSVTKSLGELEHQAHTIAGKSFNVNSPRQLEALLFDELGLKPIKRTKTSRSTDAATLEALSDEHELPRVILELRQLAKLQGTYIEALPRLLNAQTGRLHTRWHQEVAATGRLSSSDPNLQNIPIRSELGRSIREAFIAPPGHVLISADYSQIELRVLAHLSQDPVLLDAFKKGQDIHRRTAMEIFDLKESDVGAEHRRRAKAVNFGVIYGQGDSALGKSLGIPRSEAAEFIAAYFRRYAGVRRFMEETLDTARASGAVHTLLGRRRLIAEINDRNRARRLAAERVAMNTPIQGTAADLLKLAMLRLKDPVTPGTRMLLTVHDELVFETPEAEAEPAMNAIRKAMQDVYSLDVPLLVDVGCGANWREAH